MDPLEQKAAAALFNLHSSPLLVAASSASAEAARLMPSFDLNAANGVRNAANGAMDGGGGAGEGEGERPDQESAAGALYAIMKSSSASNSNAFGGNAGGRLGSHAHLPSSSSSMGPSTLSSSLNGILFAGGLLNNNNNNSHGSHNGGPNNNNGMMFGTLSTPPPSTSTNSLLGGATSFSGTSSLLPRTRSKSFAAPMTSLNHHLLGGSGLGGHLNGTGGGLLSSSSDLGISSSTSSSSSGGGGHFLGLGLSGLSSTAKMFERDHDGFFLQPNLAAPPPSSATRGGSRPRSLSSVGIRQRSYSLSVGNNHAGGNSTHTNGNHNSNGNHGENGGKKGGRQRSASTASAASDFSHGNGGGGGGSNGGAVVIGYGFAPNQVGAYSPESRQKRIEKFLEKRQRRIWRKRIKYDVRKNFADSRLRVKGRFVRKEDEDQLRDFLQMIL